jgi:hypothetical protein
MSWRRGDRVIVPAWSGPTPEEPGEIIEFSGTGFVWIRLHYSRVLRLYELSELRKIEESKE